MRYLETTAATRQKPGGRSDFPSILGGFPHSEIHGSKGIRTSPWLIAAYHVLHRLCMPRHPPIALKTLDCSHCQYPSEASLDGDWQQKDQLLEICPVAAVRQANHVPEIERLRRRTAQRAEPEQIFSLRCHTEQASDRSPLQTCFMRTTAIHPLDTEMVEPDGIEPTTPCLQSRCSPS